MKKKLLLCTLSLFLALQAASLLAEEANEHQGHQAVSKEHDHAKAVPAQEKSSTGTHQEQMEGKMIKMSVRMEKMQRELDQAQERMVVMQGQMEKAGKLPPGEERTQLLAEHGAGLRTLLTGFRDQIEKMMAQMEQQHGKDKDAKAGQHAGMDHTGDKKDQGDDKKDHGGGMMNPEMMEDMAGHHDMMRKRMSLLVALLGQMETHLAVGSAPR